MLRESRALRITLGIFFFAVIVYALFEARGLLSGPSITVPDGTPVVHESLTHIRGTAERITELRLNGKQIPVTESGAFDEPFLLAEGSNYLILEARDQRGRTAHKTLHIVYTPLDALTP